MTMNELAPCARKFTISECQLCCPNFRAVHVFGVSIHFELDVSYRLRLYPKDFFQILIALPPEKERAAIANYLNERTVKIDKIVKAVNSQINNLKELRKILINDVVAGKIKVVDNV